MNIEINQSEIEFHYNRFKCLIARINKELDSNKHDFLKSLMDQAFCELNEFLLLTKKQQQFKNLNLYVDAAILKEFRVFLEVKNYWAPSYGDCKVALYESNLDFEDAFIWLRKAGFL